MVFLWFSTFVQSRLIGRFRWGVGSNLFVWVCYQQWCWIRAMPKDAKKVLSVDDTKMCLAKCQSRFLAGTAETPQNGMHMDGEKPLNRSSREVRKCSHATRTTKKVCVCVCRLTRIPWTAVLWDFGSIFPSPLKHHRTLSSGPANNHVMDSAKIHRKQAAIYAACT